MTTMMSPEKQIPLDAMAYVQGGRIGLDTAESLADAVIRSLADDGTTVLISVKGLLGVSSSFFNLVFQMVLDQLGPNAVRDRIDFQTTSQVQMSIIDRSRAAVLDADTQ